MFTDSVIAHVIKTVLGVQSTTDRYGFPSGGRNYTFNRSYGSTATWRNAGVIQYVRWDEISESADRRRGNFKDPTPYYISQTRKLGQRVRRIGFRPYPGGNWFNDSIWIYDPPIGSVESLNALPEADADANAYINAKVLDAASQWSAAVDAAELGQTANLLSESAKSLFKLSYGVVKRNPRIVLDSFGLKPTRRLLRQTRAEFRRLRNYANLTVGDAAAAFWLKYRYGVMPLLYSVEDSIAAFNDRYDPHFEAQVTVSREESRPPTVYKDIPNWHWVWTHESSLKIKKSVRLKTTVSFRDSLTARIAGNPVALVLGTAWELMPYSFVIDWFVKVGDYINQLNLETLTSSFTTVKTVKGYVVATSKITSLKLQSGYSLPKEYVYYDDELKPMVFTNRSFRRSIVQGPQMGSLQFGSGLSPTFRQLDAASLIFAKIRKLNAFSFK